MEPLRADLAPLLDHPLREAAKVLVAVAHYRSALHLEQRVVSTLKKYTNAFL